jgi:hypothetical protein
MTLARDHVRKTFFSFLRFICWTRPSSRGSANGPFFSERDI